MNTKKTLKRLEKLKKQIETLEIEIMDERKYGRAYLIFLRTKRKG